MNISPFESFFSQKSLPPHSLQKFAPEKIAPNENFSS